MAESLIEKLAHRMRFARRDDIIVRLVLLKHQPHGLDEISGMSPIAFGVEVAEIEFVLQTRA